MKKRQSFIKNAGSKLNDLSVRMLLSKPKNLALSNFSAVKKFVIDEMLKYKNPYPFFDGLLIRSTSKIANVDMNERDRCDGKGGFTLKKSISLWLNGFTAFSVKPLRAASILGFVFASMGFIFGLYVVIHKLLHPDAVLAGYSSLISIIMFVSGVIMIILGLIGEYIGRIYNCLNNSPQYVIRETFNFDTKD